MPVTSWWPRLIGASLVAVVGLGAGCGDDDDDVDDPGATPTPVHWTYEGERGPDHWRDLSPEFATCESGEEQSPVELATAVPQDLPDIAFDYQESPLAIQNDGHTIQVTYEEGSAMSVGGETYELAQFHFHAHSEHTIGGETFPLEMHLVHQAADGRLAVVGVFVQKGAANPAFDTVFENLPEEESEQLETVEGATVDATDLLPDETSHFAYRGSLTTPPCSEGVSWFVLDQPVELSEAQIGRFTAIFEDNYRPTQPLGEREVLLDNE